MECVTKGYLHCFKVPLPRILINCKVEKKSNFVVEKLDRQHLNQVTNVTNISDKISWERKLPDRMQWEQGIPWWCRFHSLNLIMRKHGANSSWRTFCKITGDFSKMSRSRVSRKDWGTISGWRRRGRTTKCSAWFWARSFSIKHIIWQLMKLEWGLRIIWRERTGAGFLMLTVVYCGRMGCVFVGGTLQRCWRRGTLLESYSQMTLKKTFELSFQCSCKFATVSKLKKKNRWHV